MKRILLAIPSYSGDMPCSLTSSILNQEKGDWEWAFVFSDGGHIIPSRNALAKQAVDARTDYVLFVDNDQILELDTVNKLLSLDKDVVCSVIKDRNGEDHVCLRENNHKLIKKVSKDRKIGYGGMGATLIKTKILKEIFDKEDMGNPFDSLQVEYKGEVIFLGEDLSFCQRARDLGYEIWAKYDSNPDHLGRRQVFKVKEEKPIEPIEYKAKYIGTGCCRSGTTFLANLMTQGGIPMGHEAFLGLPFGGTYYNNMQGEVSWLAAPHLEREKANGATIIHLIRNPLKQISSAMKSHILEDHCFKSNVYTMYKEIFIPELQRYRLKDRYILHWLKWNEMIKPHADFTYRLEDLVENPKELFEDLGHNIDGIEFDVSKKNSYKDVKYLELKDFEDCLYYEHLKAMMKYYEYIK